MYNSRERIPMDNDALLAFYDIINTNNQEFINLLNK